MCHTGWSAARAGGACPRRAQRGDRSLTSRACPKRACRTCPRSSEEDTGSSTPSHGHSGTARTCRATATAGTRIACRSRSCRRMVWCTRTRSLIGLASTADSWSGTAGSRSPVSRSQRDRRSSPRHLFPYRLGGELVGALRARSSWRACTHLGRELRYAALPPPVVPRTSAWPPCPERNLGRGRPLPKSCDR